MTEETRNALYNRILAELNGMAENVVANYQVNMKNRENNPFLVFEDTNAKKYMALSRSIDAQLGNRMERIVFYIARLRYGVCHVPNIVEINIIDREQRNVECVLYSVSCDLPISEQNRNFNPYKQYVFVNKQFTEKEIKTKLKVKAHSTSLKRLSFIFRDISESTMEFLLENDKKKFHVDLLFFDCFETDLDNANAFEIKMGGNLDTKNSESNAREVKKLSDLFSFLTNNSAYFATCYGECSTAVKNDVEKVLGNNSICNNIEFWNRIIPSEKFTYEDFVSVYTDAFYATQLEKKVCDLK